MKIIVNNIIPFHGYIAMMFYGIIFWRKEYESKLNSYYKDEVVNHESIHLAQMKDFCKWTPVGGTIFYLLYFFEWLFRVIFTEDRFTHKAYRNISFEKEARAFERDYEYLNTRKRFAQWKM